MTVKEFFENKMEKAGAEKRAVILLLTIAEIRECAPALSETECRMLAEDFLNNGAAIEG